MGIRTVYSGSDCYADERFRAYIILPKYRPSNPKTTLLFKALKGICIEECKVAERQGFEPWEALTSTVFKTAAFDHSATSPVLGGCARQANCALGNSAGAKLQAKISANPCLGRQSGDYHAFKMRGLWLEYSKAAGNGRWYKGKADRGTGETLRKFSREQEIGIYENSS